MKPHVKELVNHAMLLPYRRVLAIGLVIGVFATLVLNLGTGWRGVGSAWVDWLDPLFSISTLIVAAGLGIDAWMNQLPKALNVHLVYDGRYVRTCWEASLAHEGDIRQWGQQVGRQMCDVSYLEFDPYPNISAPRTRLGEHGLRKVYEIKIHLTKPVPGPGYVVWGPERGDEARLDEPAMTPLTVDQVRRMRGHDALERCE